MVYYRRPGGVADSFAHDSNMTIAGVLIAVHYVMNKLLFENGSRQLYIASRQHVFMRCTCFIIISILLLLSLSSSSSNVYYNSLAL